MMHFPEHLSKLIQVLRKLPGVGNKSAERFAFHILSWSCEQQEEMADLLLNIKDKLKSCPECGCLIGEKGCFFCSSKTRNQQMICVIANQRDAFAIEETHEYHGVYHVLGGLLSPLSRRGPQMLSIPKLKERIESLQAKEIVIALDSTLEGDATALHLKKELENTPLRISRLAFGLPMGSALDYVDGGTLARAFSSRNQF